MQLTILGGGGSRVPLLFRALCRDASVGVDRLVLHDVSQSRLDVVQSVLTEMSARAGGRGPRVRATTDLRAAVRGSTFVFSAVRVGGLRGRVCDERVALSHGVLGQETTGAGGVTYGLRTVPEVLRIGSVVADEAPDAWLVNFTNPAGMVTEAMRTRLGDRLGDRVVGICDSPVGLCRRVAKALGIPVEHATFDYAGLNHLGWLQRVLVEGEDVLPSLLANEDLLRSIEEARLFGPEWLRVLGTIPNEYLWYWYFRSEAMSTALVAGQTRGEVIHTQQADLYRPGQTDGGEGAAGRWEASRRLREQTYMSDGRSASGSGERDPEDLRGGGYDEVAIAFMRAVSKDAPATLVLDVPNRGTLPFLDDDAVIEVPCQVDARGPRPLSVGPLDLHAQGLVASMKAVERATIEAACTRSRSLSVKALALHPLVGSVTVARGIIDEQLRTLPELAHVLTRD